MGATVTVGTGDDGTRAALALVLALVPFATSAVSFLMSYLCENPLRRKREALELELLRQEETVAQLQAAAAEIQAYDPARELQLLTQCHRQALVPCGPTWRPSGGNWPATPWPSGWKPGRGSSPAWPPPRPLPPKRSSPIPTPQNHERRMSHETPHRNRPDPRSVPAAHPGRLRQRRWGNHRPAPGRSRHPVPLPWAQPVHLAVVAGEAANSPAHDYTGEALSTLLTTLCRQGGHLTLVEADGAPYLLYSEAVAAPDASLTENKQDQIVQAQVTQAAAFLTENAVPKTAEVDLVAALDLAALGLQGQAGNRVLYAAFNGLSTAGPMDFTQNLLRADPEAVADALEAQGNLVSLSGVHVALTGLGDVAGEQAPLTLSAKENLQAIWQAYLTRCGAASVTFPGEYSTGQAPAGAPAVTPVPVLQDEPLSFLAQEGGLVLDDTSPLRFVGDEATYLDEAAAQETLAPVAEALRANPEQQVLIVGTTASLPGQEAACQALSQARAETAQATLIELGVSPAQLTTLGLGFDRDPWHIDDLGPDGLQVEANAQLNRKVVLLDAAGQEARGLMG